MVLRWITSTGSLSCSIRSSANDNGRLLSPIFTVKQIVMRTIWPILVILLCLVFILLMSQTGVCPTDFVMML
ncbi:hypothetical protein LINGRAHAP2_LOCUS28823 [Linum grandiflorum]